jgi:hypothetical protein
MEITWFGLSCFRLSERGVLVLYVTHMTISKLVYLP